MTDAVVIEHFRAMLAGPGENRNLGRISPPDATAEGEGCRGGRDHLFLYLTIQDRKILDIKFECATCDPTMLVTANVLCDLARGRDTRSVRKLQPADFFRVLGQDSQGIAEHCGPALEVLGRALDRYCEDQGITLGGA